MGNFIYKYSKIANTCDEGIKNDKWQPDSIIQPWTQNNLSDGL